MTTSAKLPYRPNVGIMVLNDKGNVWVGRRANIKDTEYEHSSALWQMPQGGIDSDEDPEKAARRELYEETGMSNVVLLDSTDGWIHYDFPPGITRRIAEKYAGQKQKWFAYRFVGDDSEIRINPPPDGHEAEFDDWRWANMEELPELIVEFKRDVYRQVVDYFRRLIL